MPRVRRVIHASRRATVTGGSTPLRGVAPPLRGATNAWPVVSPPATTTSARAASAHATIACVARDLVGRPDPCRATHTIRRVQNERRPRCHICGTDASRGPKVTMGQHGGPAWLCRETKARMCSQRLPIPEMRGGSKDGVKREWGRSEPMLPWDELREFGGPNGRPDDGFGVLARSIAACCRCVSLGGTSGIGSKLRRFQPRELYEIRGDVRWGKPRRVGTKSARGAAVGRRTCSSDWPMHPNALGTPCCGM